LINEMNNFQFIYIKGKSLDFETDNEEKNYLTGSLNQKVVPFPSSLST
jgi:hypothetical protein